MEILKNRIKIAYAKDSIQVEFSLDIANNSTLKDAIIESGILERFKEIDLEKNKVGIFGRIKKLETLLKDGDRIEIYRPLIIDPKEARRKKLKREKISR